MRLAEAHILDSGTSDSLRRAAEVFEFLADLDEGPTHTTSLLLSAALFQLAGYAANSVCISRGLTLTPPPTALALDVGSRLLDRGLGLALQRRFVRLLRETRAAAVLFHGSEDAFVELLHRHDAPPEVAASLPVADLTAQALEQLSAHALSGVPIDSFLETTTDLHDLLLSTGNTELLLRADLLASLGRRLAETSIWTELAEQIARDGVWKRYAMLCSRGRGTSALEARSDTELWRSQLTALRSGLLSHAESGLAVRMPTSAGKTRIAELSILQTLTEHGRRVVYVAPFNALADEIEASMSALFSDLGFRVSTVLGSYDLDKLEEDLVTSSDLLITTPEKLTLLLRLQPTQLDSVGLLVLDEGHIIDSKDRGIGYELLLTRLRRRMSDDSRILFLSAVISDDNASDFAEWLCKDRSAMAASNWRPARRLIGVYDAGRNRIDYLPDDSNPVESRSSFVPRVIERKEYRDFTRKQRREKIVEFPGMSKGEITAELALKFSAEGPVIVFTTQPRWAESCARAIGRALLLRRQTEGEDIPDAFRKVNDRGYSPSALAVAESWLGSESSVMKVLRDGIGVHHAGLPEAVRRAVENDFRGGLLPVMAATGTLAQGVNLPVKTVLIHTLHQHDEDAEEGDDQRVTLLDFWNTVGRAGRAGAETEGHIIVIELNSRDARRAGRYLRTEPPAVRGQLYDLLESLVEDRLTYEDFRARLDSDLLSTLVEEVVGTDAETRYASLIGDSFVSIQARNLGVETTRLIDTGVSVIGDIRQEVPESASRQAFALTGLDVATCKSIEERILEEEDEIRRLLTDPMVRPQEIICEIHSSIADLPTFIPKFDFVGDINELVADWLGQKPMRDITSAHLPTTSDVNRFHRDFVSDYLGYKLPWGITSLIPS